MKTKIIFLLFSLEFLLVFNLEDIKMIADVINSYNRPAHVLANVCWNPVTKLKLTAELGRTENAKFTNYINNAADIDNIKLTKTPYLFFIVDSSCTGAEIFLKRAAAANLFGKFYRWLILAHSGNYTNGIPETLANLPIMTDAEVMVSRFHDEMFSLHMMVTMGPKDSETRTFLRDISTSLFTQRISVYKIKKHDENWHVEFYGNWKTISGLAKSTQMNIASAMRRRNLENNTVITSMIAVDNKTIENVYDLSNVEVDTVSKANIRHVDCLYYFMNASRVIKFINTWGYFINGSWNGIVGHFVRGEADIAASVMFITKERIKVIQFVSQPTNIIVAFIFREPPLSYHSNLYILPFNKMVWICLAAFILILMIIIYVNAYWETKKSKSVEISDPTAIRPKLSDIAVFLISALCQQGSSLELRGGVGRIIMFLVFLTFLFLYTSYSASIVALLQSSSSHIRTLADLYNSKMELGIENLPYNVYFFSVAKEPLRKAIFENRIAPKGRKPNYFSLEEGVKKLQTKPFAFNMNIGVGYKLINKYFQEHEKCGLQQISYIENNHAWLSCAKNSPYAEIFKIGLQRSLEHGLLDRVNNLIYAKKPLCSVRGGSFISVNIMDFYPVLLMLFFGMLLSILLLLMEILYHRNVHK